MASRLDNRRFSDRDAYQKALKRQFTKSPKQSRAEYEEKVEVVRVPSPLGRIFRNTSIVLLTLILLILALYFGKELRDDKKSREHVAELQAFVTSPEAEAASAGGTAETVVTESIADTEQEGEATPVRSEAVAIPPERLSKYWELYRQNNDFCGWLTIPDTVVDYPVMHLPDDNDFYLSHDFAREEDVNGLLVLDKRCASDGEEEHLLIHGHNMKSGFMFGSLKNYKDPEYLKTHPTIRYDSLFGSRTYEILAVFLSSTNLADEADFHYYDYIQIDTEEDFEAYVDAARQQSLYPIDVDVSYGDYLLTLSTCDYTKDNGRLVIVARSHAEEFD